MLNEFPFMTIFGVFGTLLSLVGIFILLAGLQILRVQNITVLPGPRTILVGFLFLIVGIVMLVPESRLQIATYLMVESTDLPAAPTLPPVPETPAPAPTSQSPVTHPPSPSPSPEPRPTETITLVEVEIAAGKTATASGYWQHPTLANYEFPPSTVIDRMKEETNCKSGDHTYWLLPDNELGWVQIDLHQDYPITRIRWLNTHNSQCEDRATTSFRIALSTSRDFSMAVYVYAGQMEFKPEPLYGQYTLPSPVQARYIRFYIDSYFGAGGGLNELEVYAEIPSP